MSDINNIYTQLDEDQKIEIQLGMKTGLDISYYARPEFLAIQMRQIRLGMEDGLDVSVYSKTQYDWFQMEEIRFGMKSGINYQSYARPEIDYQRMRQLRKALEKGIDLSNFVKLEAGILEELRKSIIAGVSIVEYIKEGYDVEQLAEIRTALKKKIDIRPYISTEYRGPSIREICLGLEAGLPVSLYSILDYNWQQMREIRLGMEARVNIDQYSNSLFSWQQMREIRLGLMDGLDVSQYRSFIYLASDMEAARKRLLREETEEIINRRANQQCIEEQISIFISKDEMEACIEIDADTDRIFTEKDIMKKLKQNGISQGILTDEIKNLVKERKYGQTIVIARGKPSNRGEDGWYEFYFDINPSRNPKILEDGTADFKNVKWFELVNEGQTIAYYHNAGFGVAGYTVTGKFLKAKKGQEKNVLRGKGFRLEEDGRTYVSLISGKVMYDGDSRLDISRVSVFNDISLATGNVEFDGTVYVKGNVGAGTTIKATENVYVDGYVEAATIKSGEEVFLRRGINGNGTGLIEAGKGVAGQFFEDVKVISGGDITAQYCLNCELYADGNVVLHGNKGLLLGGYVRASKGLTAYSIGNKMGIKTIIDIGIGQDTLQQQQKINIDIENVNRELTILTHSQTDFCNKYAAEVRNQMEIYLKIENAIYTKNLQLKQLYEEKSEMEQYIDEMKGARILIEGVLYEGTEISIDNVKWKAFSVRGVEMSCVREKIIVESL